MRNLRPAGIGSEQEREGALKDEVHESEHDARNAKDTLLQWQEAYGSEARELDVQESGEHIYSLSGTPGSTVVPSLVFDLRWRCRGLDGMSLQPF